jgi:hypothetical protein
LSLHSISCVRHELRLVGQLIYMLFLKMVDERCELSRT